MAFLDAVAKRVAVALAIASALVVGASAQRASAPPRMTVDQALALAQKGRCAEALPSLRTGVPRIPDKKARVSAAMAQARCGMSVNDADATISAVALMRRDAPHDPEVLYISARYLSQLANRSAQELVETAPSSVQAQKLEAESLEAQGKPDEALAQYRKILEADPKAPEIHYRIAQLLLNKPSPDADEARKEFEAELQNDPTNASAEFMLGELARRAGQWDPAIDHFGRAAKLDAGFLEAYLALGMSLNAAGKYADAVDPLQHYIKLAPADPAGHYQLAMAYARTGNREAAARESELQRKLAEKTTQNIH